ncbi:hypothetical protein CMV_019119 [Castanea mollissima]|uniref:methylmalonate-semialdehyde dehydrogenase (CoA acylating) n=1 Tax=Castanea mollissima TaxID=60419 RepID=A0A8J4QNJ6_9ROSI|nr:hypothetical protein CMV_019119 [Castanea mollissima]
MEPGIDEEPEIVRPGPEDPSLLTRQRNHRSEDIWNGKARMHIYARAVAKGKRVQSNMGAKNHAIVMPDANEDATLNALVAAGFGAAGQRCMALSTAHASPESSGRRKTSKYFATDKQKPKDEKETKELPTKRKAQKHNDELVKPPPAKKVHIVDDDDDDDFVISSSRKKLVDMTSSKKLKSGSGRGIAQKLVDIEEGNEDDDKDIETPHKCGGRGCGGRGSSAASAGGRGRGGGRGGFMNFGERIDPPHKGEKEVPEGAPNCLAGSAFVISGTLDSLEREEAEDLIKRHGGRVTGSIGSFYRLSDDNSCVLKPWI